MMLKIMTIEQIKNEINQIFLKIKNKQEFTPVILSETEENKELVEDICVQLGLITKDQCVGWNLLENQLFFINSNLGSFIIVKLIPENKKN